MSSAFVSTKSSVPWLSIDGEAELLFSGEGLMQLRITKHDSSILTDLRLDDAERLLKALEMTIDRVKANILHDKLHCRECGKERED